MSILRYNWYMGIPDKDNPELTESPLQIFAGNQSKYNGTGVARLDLCIKNLYFVVEVTQRRRGYFDPEEQQKMDKPGTKIPRKEDGDFKYRAGCTFFLDPKTLDIPWVIRTAAPISSDEGLDRMRRVLLGEDVPERNAFDSQQPRSLRLEAHGTREEPFALLHDQED